MIAALVLTPLIKFFGAGLTTNIFPAPPGELIKNMSASLVFDRYVRYIAAGAVAAGGIISLLRSLPTTSRLSKREYETLAAVAKPVSSEPSGTSPSRWPWSA